MQLALDSEDLDVGVGKEAFAAWQELAADIKAALPPSANAVFQATGSDRTWEWLHIQEVGVLGPPAHLFVAHGMIEIAHCHYDCDWHWRAGWLYHLRSRHGQVDWCTGRAVDVRPSCHHGVWGVRPARLELGPQYGDQRCAVGTAVL